MPLPSSTRQIVLASRPAGLPAKENFRLEEVPLPALNKGECLIHIRYASVDPYMRGRIRDTASYAAPIPIGGLMTGGSVGEVIASEHSHYKPGDIVQGDLGWREYAVAKDSEVRQVNPSHGPISTSLGVLGMPGLTAYFGLLDLSHPKHGETVVVSGAAGAVGSIVGQIAKIKGCRAVGIAGTDEKVRHLVEDLGFDAAFNYKTVSDYRAELQRLCPDGIDVYFDNVGGAITDAVFHVLNIHSRVSVCGQISQYNLEKPEMGPRPLWHLIVKRIRMEGFLVFDFADRYADGLHTLASWLKHGQIQYRETIVEGLENTPAAFIGMLTGANIGKQLVRVSGG